MTSEIELLKQQKREIEQRLRELEQAEKYVRVGRVKMTYERYTGCAPDYYCVSVLLNKVTLSHTKKTMWRGIIQGERKSEAVAQIPEVIADLQQLYEQLKGEEDE